MVKYYLACNWNQSFGTTRWVCLLFRLKFNCVGILHWMQRNQFQQVQENVYLSIAWRKKHKYLHCKMITTMYLWPYQPLSHRSWKQLHSCVQPECLALQNKYFKWIVNFLSFFLVKFPDLSSFFLEKNENILIEASTTRKCWIPWTCRCGSTTASGSVFKPILTVPTWCCKLDV